MIPAFPKIFALGTRWVAGIFDSPVEVTEKVDGSQFCFGKVEGKLYMRSRGAEIHPGSGDRLFNPAIEHVQFIEKILPDNTVFYGETLCKPKHNTIEYERVPTNNIMLFGAMKTDLTFLPDLDEYALVFNVDRAPVLFSGMITDVDMLYKMIDRKSYLGKANIEGVVVKNYKKDLVLGECIIPLMSAKLVSEKFKEVHASGWKKEQTLYGKIEKLKEMFRTEARWSKAIQHLRESGTLEGSPRDIGPLIKEIHRDVEEEGCCEIKEELYKMIGKSIVDSSTFGFPEWYKKQLAKQCFPKEEK
jgi:hypothetical protein